MRLQDLLAEGVEVLPVWAVHQGDSERHAGTPKWFFDEEIKARDVAKGRGWYGGDAPVSQHQALTMGGKGVLLQPGATVDINIGPEDEDKIRQNALAKLSESEKRILGIK